MVGFQTVGMERQPTAENGWLLHLRWLCYSQHSRVVATLVFLSTPANSVDPHTYKATWNYNFSSWSQLLIHPLLFIKSTNVTVCPMLIKVGDISPKFTSASKCDHKSNRVIMWQLIWLPQFKLALNKGSGPLYNLGPTYYDNNCC